MIPLFIGAILIPSGLVAKRYYQLKLYNLIFTAGLAMILGNLFFNLTTSKEIENHKKALAIIKKCTDQKIMEYKCNPLVKKIKLI